MHRLEEFWDVVSSGTVMTRLTDNIGIVDGHQRLELNPLYASGQMVYWGATLFGRLAVLSCIFGIQFAVFFPILYLFTDFLWGRDYRRVLQKVERVRLHY